MTQRESDFSCVVDNFLAPTERIKRDAQKELKNGDIVELAERIREQVGAILSVKNVFAEMECPEAKEVVESLDSMVKVLRQIRKQLPPVVCTMSRKPRQKKKTKKSAN